MVQANDYLIVSLSSIVQITNMYHAMPLFNRMPPTVSIFQLYNINYYSTSYLMNVSNDLPQMTKQHTTGPDERITRSGTWRTTTPTVPASSISGFGLALSIRSFC